MNFNAAIHQARMNEIDRLCYRDYVSSNDIGAAIHLGKTHTNTYLSWMEGNGYITSLPIKYGGKKYKSTHTFVLSIDSDSYGRAPSNDKGEFTRKFPSVRPFADDKALPRGFFNAARQTL